MANFLKLSTTTGVPTGTAMVLTDLPSIGNNTFLANISGSAGTPTAVTATAAFGVLSPLTTKGDILVYSTLNTRQPVPGDYGRHIPDSNQTTGWRNASYTQIQQGRPGKNYIQYADFENNSTTGWTLGTVGTLTNGLPTGTPTFGSGASGNLSIATTSTSIEGAYSLNYVSSTATTVGNMVATSAYTIDSEDQGKVLTVKFYYSPVSGASNCNFSGTSSNSFAWAIYDVTNSSWLTSAGNFNLIQNSGSGYVTGTCQTNITTSQIRLVIYNANATSGAATLTLDGFYVGPQTAPSGPAMTDWSTNLSVTPNSFGTVTNQVTETRRVGDTLYVRCTFTSGTLAASTASISLPSGLSIDSSKLPSNSSGTAVGISYGPNSSTSSQNFWYASSGAGTSDTAILFYDGSTTSQVFFGQFSSNTSLVKINANSAFNAGPVTLEFKVPIAGWSSNTSQSSDTDTRVVACVATNSSTPTSGSTITGWTTTNDTHGAFNASTGVYTVPVTGYYQIIFVVPGFGAGSSSYSSAHIVANGVSYTGPTSVANTTIGWTGSNNITVYLLTGQTITFNFTAQSSPTLSGFSGNMSINRLSGPAVVSATESVGMSYGLTTGYSYTPAGSAIKYDTKIYDTHNAYSTSTGNYTAPVSGKYRVSVSGYGFAGDYILIINGVNKVYLCSESQSVGICGGSQTYPVLAGQTIAVGIDSTGTLASSSTVFYNYISIERVGN